MFTFNINRIKKINIIAILSAIIFLVGCASSQPKPDVLTQETYNEVNTQTHGIAIIELPWSPNSISCTTYDNIQVEKLHFINWNTGNLSQEPEIVIHKNQKLTESSGIYVIPLEAGSYALSTVIITANQTIRDNSRGKTINIPEGQLFFDNNPIAQFTIDIGDLIYLGSIEPGCSIKPIFKRSFVRNSDVPDFLEDAKSVYPFIPWEDVEYKLLEISSDKFSDSYDESCPDNRCFAVE